jgi:aspartate aminotransferase
MLMKLAKRLSVVEPSMTLKVTAKAAELRSQGVDVVSFGAGEPDFDTPAHIKDAAKKALDAGATKYTAVEGTPALRKAAAAWLGKAHGFEVNPREVMVSAGAKQSLFNAFHVLLDEGDEIIIPAPYWVSYAEIAKLAGAKPVPVVSRPEDEFIVNPEAVAQAITPRTRLILIGSPTWRSSMISGCSPTTSTGAFATAMPASCSRPHSAPRCASAPSSWMGFPRPSP